MLTVSHTDAFRSETCRHDRHSVRESLQDFDPCATACAIGTTATSAWEYNGLK